MTLHTPLLDLRLAQAVALAQQAVVTGAPDGVNSHATFDLPHGLLIDVQRTLRQFSLLQRERTTLESALAAAPTEQRGQAQSRLSLFDADLARLLGRAARLAFLLLALRRRSGDAVGFEGARAVQHLGTVFGQTPDPTVVRSAVQRLSTQPLGAAEGVAPGALTEALFIALALVMALAPRGAGSA
jgi:hypothetical protein